VPTDAACRGRCVIAAVEYEWRRQVDGGWRLATAEELALLAAEGGGYLSLRLGSEVDGEGVGVVIPVAQPAGTLDAPRLRGVWTSDVCHLGLSVDDKLGMRHFAGIQNTPGSCGAPM
jgi:hypothetical protein